MTFRWATQPDVSADLAEAGLAQEFDSQQLAEQWLSDYFIDLVELGAAEVTLFDGDRMVYGPMPLSA